MDNPWATSQTARLSCGQEKDRCRGASLGIVLIVLMTFSILGLGLISQSGENSVDVVKRRQSMQSFWSVEAGLAQTRCRLAKDPVFRSSPVSVLGSVGGIPFSVDIATTNSFDYLLTGTATSLVWQRTLQMELAVVDTHLESLLLLTKNDVSSPSGVPGLSSWDDGEVIEITGPSLVAGSNTMGTFSRVLDLDAFNTVFVGGDLNVDLDACHLVTTNITVGSTNSISLLEGDLLLSTEGGEILDGAGVNQLVVEDEDVFIFRPDTPGDFSSGIFLMLLDMGAINNDDTRGIALVETDTQVGPTLVPASTFLIAKENRRDIILFTADNVGEGTTSGNEIELVDGQDLAFGSEILGLGLVSVATQFGELAFKEGTIFVTLNSDGSAVGNRGTPITVNSEDVFYLNVIQTGSSSLAEAFMLFDGSDVGLNTQAEEVDGIATPAGMEEIRSVLFSWKER